MSQEEVLTYIYEKYRQKIYVISDEKDYQQPYGEKVCINCLPKLMKTLYIRDKKGVARSIGLICPNCYRIEIEKKELDKYILRR